MKTRVVLFMLLLPLFGFSQKHSIDVVGSFDWTYRALMSRSLMGDQVVASRMNEIPKYNWRAGINYNRQLSEKWFLKTGARLAKVGYKTKKQVVFFDNDQTAEPGDENDLDLSFTRQFSYDFLFLEIPIMFRYEFSQKKWTPFVEGGLSTSYYLSTKETLSINEEEVFSESTNQSDAFIPINLVANFSTGLNYNIAEHWQLFGQVVFRYHLNPIVKDGNMKEHLYNLGWAMGMRRKF